MNQTESFTIYRLWPELKEAVCLGCGCSDTKACFENGQACSWLTVDREQQQAVVRFDAAVLS